MAFALLTLLHFAVPCAVTANMVDVLANPGPEEHPGVTRLREYIRLNSSQPDPNYGPCVEWFRQQADEIGLTFNYEKYSWDDPNSFAVWMTWEGSRPDLQSILIGSHMDTVAADPDKWIYPPWSAYKDEEGRIFGRGAADMKSTTVATLEAARALKRKGFIPQRTIHIAVFPDEELYNRGAKGFVNSDTFDELNIGFVLSEGSGIRGGKLLVSYAQRTRWLVKFIVHSERTTHSSAMPRVTTGEMLTTVLNRMMEFRSDQFELDSYDSGSVNLVELGGGIGTNTIPDELWAIFDLRLSSVALKGMEDLLNEVADEAGKETEIQYLIKDPEFPKSVVNDSSPWWRAVKNICQHLRVTCTPVFGSAVGDGRFFRAVGIPVFGMGGVGGGGRHSENEWIDEKTFITGIGNFQLFIKFFSSVPSTIKDSDRLWPTKYELKLSS